MKMRVFVGMSGGVDSSVAALRLLRDGYDVVGVFIKVWQPDFIHCNWEAERLDAMRVAAHLGIPFLTMNAEDVYKREVADYMIRSYKAGITPNPDVMCNEHVKFGAFYTWAKSQGADMIATGHYAQLRDENGKKTLHRAIDETKDQSYFLWRVKQSIFEDVLFPVGDTLKSNLRAEAQKAGIPTAKKADSQGICFLGQVDMPEFLSHYIEFTEGDVLDETNEKIGIHQGAILYTLGQRHGFTVTKTEERKPHYVVSRDITKNTITVSSKMKEGIDTTITLVETNEIGDGVGNGILSAVSRYHGTPVRVTVKLEDASRATLKAQDLKPHDWVSGQSCVLYRGSACVGGGVILK